MKKTETRSNFKNYIYLLMLGHLSVDMNQGALPAILPFLIAARGLSYTSAASLVFASNISSSVVQPLFGHLGDRSSRYWFISLGLILAGSGFAMVGLLDAYWAVFIAVVVSGIGNAIFHPEGGRLSNQVSGGKKSSNMSIFAVGGSLAFAVGPLIVSFAITNYGMGGTAVFFIPAFVMAAVSLIMIRGFHIAVGNSASNNAKDDERVSDASDAGAVGSRADVSDADAAGSRADASDAGAAGSRADIPSVADDWPAFVRLSIFVFFRAAILTGISTFIPLYWVGVLTQTQAAGSIALAIYSFSTVFSTLIGGFLADRYGYIKILRISSLSFIPFLALFTFIPDLRLSTILLIPLGFTLFLCFSTVITLGQAFIPNHIGFASGITMGMGVSVGGVTAPLLGKIGDLYGLTAVFYALIALACITAATGSLVPGKKR
jgi:FSR family fosmidomycin resistance protein-like MFS transporter